MCHVKHIMSLSLSFLNPIMKGFNKINPKSHLNHKNSGFQVIVGIMTCFGWNSSSHLEQGHALRVLTWSHAKWSLVTYAYHTYSMFDGHGNMGKFSWLVSCVYPLWLMMWEPRPFLEEDSSRCNWFLVLSSFLQSCPLPQEPKVRGHLHSLWTTVVTAQHELGAYIFCWAE